MTYWTRISGALGLMLALSQGCDTNELVFGDASVPAGGERGAGGDASVRAARQ